MSWLSRFGFSRLWLAGVAVLGGACSAEHSAGDETAFTASELPRYGIIALGSRYTLSGEPPRAYAEAFFWQAEDEGSTGCEVVLTVDGCEVSECLPVSAVPPATGFDWVSAGTVDISGTTSSFSFTEAERGEYTSTLPSLDMFLWKGGEQLTAVVQGSREYPQVRATLTAPAPVLLNAPLELDSALEARAALPLSWSSPADDWIYVDLKEVPGRWETPPTERSARCAFAASTGGGSIPIDVFDALSPPGLLSGYRMFVSTKSEAELSAGDATLTFSVWSSSHRVEAALPRPTGQQ